MSDNESREDLIRRRWAETGSKLWKHDFHGAGLASLNIQGRSSVTAADFGSPKPEYDNLEFRMVRSLMNGQPIDNIVCQGVIVKAPKRE